MKKKFLIPIILALVFILLFVGTVSAKNSKLNIKGKVTAISSTSITVNSQKGEYTVAIPAGMVVSDIAVGDDVVLKAEEGADGGWVATSIKAVGQGGDDKDAEDEAETEDDQDEAEGKRDNSAFCTEGKQDKPHPLAPALAERYGADEAWVMDTFCDGYSIGAIMLALKTSQLDGVTASPDELLAGRSEGVGWGALWKDMGLIGSEKNGHSPPGLLKKPKKQK